MDGGGEVEGEERKKEIEGVKGKQYSVERDCKYVPNACDLTNQSSDSQ